MDEQQQPRINRILQSLDDLAKPDAPPFLATRVRAQLQRLSDSNDSVWERIGNWLARPGVFAAVLVIILAVNAGLLWQAIPNQPNTYQTATSTAEEDTDAFAVSDSNSPLLP